MPTETNPISQENVSQTLLAKSHTEMTFQNTKDFNRLIRKKYRIATLSSCIVFALFGIYMLLSPVLNVSNIVLFFILSLFFFIMYLSYCGIFDTEKQFKQKTFVSGTGQDFYFYQTAFVVLLSNGSAPQTQINYISLLKVTETDSYFYLYPSKNSAYLISKSGFTEGSAEELSTILHGVLPISIYPLSGKSK